MLAPAPLACAIYGVSELLLALRKRAGSTAERSDRGSLAVFWIVIALGLLASVVSAAMFPQFEFHLHGALLIGVATLFAAGLALRWWAIFVLGRWFTDDVAIHADHQLVTAGPYQWVRHPSYTGAALAFVGMALMFEHWLALPLLLLGVALAFLYRIRVEEQALAGAFGPRWVEYASRTSRLIPGLY
jgi:protein-S-isoprenylcysteine O-methyltransferase